MVKFREAALVTGTSQAVDLFFRTLRGMEAATPESLEAVCLPVDAIVADDDEPHHVAEAQAQRAQEAQATIREELRAEAGKQTVALDRWTEALGAALHASLEALAIGRFQELVSAGCLAACVGRGGPVGRLAWSRGCGCADAPPLTV